jgi:hypothetical protein
MGGVVVEVVRGELKRTDDGRLLRSVAVVLVDFWICNAMLLPNYSSLLLYNYIIIPQDVDE